MKLLNKRTVFLSSADRASGDLGQFAVPMPLDFTFDPTSVFKLFVSQINMRNTFFAIRPDNCQYFVNIGGYNTPVPANTPTPAGNFGVWTAASIPRGAPVASEIAAGINQTLQTLNTSLFCVLRYGRLYFVQNTNGLPTYQVNLYFGNSNVPTPNTGPGHEACGFPNPNHIYKILPDANNIPNGTALRYSYDGYSNLPSDGAMSPQLMNTNDVSDILVTTNMPHENYTLDDNGVSVTGVTVDIPVLVPAGGTICYTDTTGINAIYERGRTTVNILNVLVTDKFMTKLVPNNDWSFVLTIEHLEDSPALALAELKKQTADDEEVIQLLKMLLLKGEM